MRNLWHSFKSWLQPEKREETLMVESSIPVNRREDAAFIRRLLFCMGAVITAGALLFIFVYAAEVFLLLFASILFSIFLRGIASWLTAHTGLPNSWGPAVIILSLFLIFVISVWAILPTIAQQIHELNSILPSSFEKIKEYLVNFPLIESIVKAGLPEQLLPSRDVLIGKSAPIATSMLGGILGFWVIVITGFYLSLNPRAYMIGFLRLFPMHKRTRVQQVLEEIEFKIRWWLIGQIVGMTVIAIIVTIGLILLKIPMAIFLGFLAGILNFIPNFGPLLSAIPAILLGLTQSPQTALWVVLLFMGTQFLESYFVTPLIQQRTIFIPPAIILFSQLLFGLLLGFLGLALATPLAATIAVIVELFYIQDILKDKTPPQ